MQRKIQEIAEDDIRRGRIDYIPPKIEVVDGGLCFFIGHPDLPEQLEDDCPVKAQYIIEIIRKERSSPKQRRFWKRYLERAEEAIAIALAYDATGDPEPEKVVANHERIWMVFEEAAEAEANRLGLPLAYCECKAVLKAYRVTLKTANGKGMIFLIPSTSYKIATALKREPEFWTYASGATAELLGIYNYQTEYNNRKSVLRTVRIDHEGAITLP